MGIVRVQRLECSGLYCGEYLKSKAQSESLDPTRYFSGYGALCGFELGVFEQYPHRIIEREKRSGFDCGTANLGSELGHIYGWRDQYFIGIYYKFDDFHRTEGIENDARKSPSIALLVGIKFTTNSDAVYMVTGGGEHRFIASDGL